MIQLQKRTHHPYDPELSVIAYSPEFDTDGFTKGTKNILDNLAAGKIEVGEFKTARSRTTIAVNTGIGRRSSSDPVHDYGDSSWVEYSIGPLSVTHVSAPGSNSKNSSTSSSGGSSYTPSDYYLP